MIEGKAMENYAISCLLGLTPEKTSITLQKFCNLQLLKRDEKRGCLYSPQLVGWYKLRRIRALAGSKGGKQKASKTLANALANTEREREKEKEKESFSFKSFEEFWNLYPRKVKRSAGLKAFLKLHTDQETFEKIKIGLARFKSSEWADREPRFIPHAATWLNGREWEDLPDVKSVSKRGICGDAVQKNGTGNGRSYEVNEAELISRLGARVGKGTWDLVAIKALARRDTWGDLADEHITESMELGVRKL
jgi:hypothetical protein